LPARLKIILLACALAAQLGATTNYVQEPQAEACRQWEELEQKVWDGKADRKEAHAKFKELWPRVTIDDLPSPKEGLWQWVFPMPGYGADDWSGQSYSPEEFKFADGPAAVGHPAINIYAHDRGRKGWDDRNAKPMVIVSATDGVVVSARKFWTEADPNPLGVYVCVLSQEEKRFFYYAHLSKLKVGLGQLVKKGQVLGWLGRTGTDVLKKNLGTHLRFEIHSFDDGLFYPVYPGRGLKDSKQLPWPLPEPKYNRLPKHLYEIPVTPTPVAP
jgi:murein DD-endopeptidase MepM/ murein hydrolase activator NlpD